MSRKPLSQLGLSLLLLVVASVFLVAEANGKSSKKDFSRKSIVFDIKTPKVFYCPQEKHSDYNKMIVKARPLEKLCEFEGQAKPKKSPSDCYNDVDETEFACDEKKRFLLRLDADQGTTTVEPGTNGEQDHYLLSKGPKKVAIARSG